LRGHGTGTEEQEDRDPHQKPARIACPANGEFPALRVGFPAQTKAFLDIFMVVRW
jgi:hypothetical protein